MSRPVNILLIEDNLADVDLTRENLEACKLLNALAVVSDGVKAMKYLRRESPYEAVERPDLILLDLNLPIKDGREVLEELKADPSLRRIPVVVLTSSMAESDVIRSYELHASAYVVKPLGLAGFAEIVKAIECFWFSVVTYAPGEDGGGGAG